MKYNSNSLKLDFRTEEQNLVKVSINFHIVAICKLMNIKQLITVIMTMKNEDIT